MKGIDLSKNNAMEDNLIYTGTQINYYMICHRKLWLYSQRLELEKTSDKVTLGKLLHETSYPRLGRREILIDSLIKVDVLEESGKLLEIKYSQRMAEAARLQILYYLYYLKQKGLEGIKGELRFPRQKRKEDVELTEEGESHVLAALREIAKINELPSPPAGEFLPACNSCAYAEFCWS